MDIGERPCELPEESNLVREPGAGDICTDAGTQLLSAVMNNVQALVEGDGDEFDDRELHIVVDEPLPGPRPSWMSEEDAEQDVVTSAQQMANYADPQCPQLQQDKRKCKASNRARIEVSLEGKSLWEEFYRRGTEMIVNRAGRRMFPGFSVSVTGLKPKAKYTMKLEVILASSSRFKFLNGHWLAVGAAEPQAPIETYVHPDSPNTGAFWTRHGVSFRKLKITNNKEKPGGNILLHSMHKYSLRIAVDEESKVTDKPPQPKNVVSVDFPETTFIAVTAYQNEEVTQLKISNNPFAKAFRETSADLDWETAQALYGNTTIFSPMPQFSPQAVPGYFPSPNPWYMHSPIPPSPSFNPSVALQGSYPSFSAPLPLHPHLRHDFQWPQPTFTHRIIDTEDYGEAHSVYTVPTSATCASHLPDFESVFVVHPQTPTSP